MMAKTRHCIDIPLPSNIMWSWAHLCYQDKDPIARQLRYHFGPFTYGTYTEQYCILPKRSGRIRISYYASNNVNYEAIKLIDVNVEIIKKSLNSGEIFYLLVSSILKCWTVINTFYGN